MATTATTRRRAGSLEFLLVGLIVLALSAGDGQRRVVHPPAAGGRRHHLLRGVFVQALPFLVLGVIVSGWSPPL